jgi:predicted transposase YbfD/YdcC
MVESRREQGEKVEIARRYYLVSLPADGVRFSNAVRQHWGVENQLHWVLDVSFAEDASRIRKDKGAQTFSVLCHTGDQSQTQASWMGSRLSLTSIDGVIQMRLP